MKIISLDQSTSKSGYSIFIDKELIDYGIIRPSKKISNDNKISMLIRLSEFIKKENPDILLIEDVYMKKGKTFNIKTHKTLSNLQGMLIAYCVLNNIKYEIIHPSSWKNGIVGKKKISKEETQEFLKEKYNKEFKEDIADSICIGLYFVKNMN